MSPIVKLNTCLYRWGRYIFTSTDIYIWDVHSTHPVHTRSSVFVNSHLRVNVSVLFYFRIQLGLCPTSQHAYHSLACCSRVRDAARTARDCGPAARGGPAWGAGQRRPLAHLPPMLLHQLIHLSQNAGPTKPTNHCFTKTINATATQRERGTFRLINLPSAYPVLCLQRLPFESECFCFCVLSSAGRGPRHACRSRAVWRVRVGTRSAGHWGRRPGGGRGSRLPPQPTKSSCTLLFGSLLSATRMLAPRPRDSALL